MGGVTHSCNYGHDYPVEDVPTGPKGKQRKKKKKNTTPNTNAGFFEGALVQTVRKARVRQSKRGQPIELWKGMKLRIKKVFTGDDGQPKKLEVTADELERPLILKARLFQFLKVIEGEPELSIDDSREEVEHEAGDNALPEIGWYEVLHIQPKSNSGAGALLEKGHIIRITKVKRAGAGAAEGKLVNSKTWVKIYDDRHKYMKHVDVQRILEYRLSADSEDEWGMAVNFPAMHPTHPWVVTRIEPQGQGARMNVQRNWKIVGVDNMMTALNPTDCETILRAGRECTIYFDNDVDYTRLTGGSFHGNHLTVDLASNPSLLQQDSHSQESMDLPKVVARKTRRSLGIQHYFFGFIGFIIVALCITVLVLLDTWSFEHLDRHDSCSGFPLVLIIWTGLIVLTLLGSIPAGCEGELHSSCVIGCTEYYGVCSWFSILYSIWALIIFFTLSDSCKDELKDRNHTWIAYQVFVWTQIGLGGLALISTFLHFYLGINVEVVDTDIEEGHDMGIAMTEITLTKPD